MSYDVKCHDLAKVFLFDVLLPTQDGFDQAADELAQHIQDSIESFLKDKGLCS